MGACHVDGEESQTKSCTRGAVTEQDLDTGSEVVVPQVEPQSARWRLDFGASASMIVAVPQGILNRLFLAQLASSAWIITVSVWSAGSTKSWTTSSMVAACRSLRYTVPVLIIARSRRRSRPSFPTRRGSGYRRVRAESGLLAAQPAFCPRDLHALTGPHPDEVGLELGDHGGRRRVPHGPLSTHQPGSSGFSKLFSLKGNRVLDPHSPGAMRWTMGADCPKAAG